MKTAVIGLGVIGRVHLQVLDELGKEVCAVCDSDEKILSAYGDKACYTDYKKMIDEIKPDVVHVCTPHYLHEEMVVYALGKGVNVLCEKPLCIDKDGLDRILQAERNSSAQLGVVLQNRYNPANAFAKEYLQDKRVVSGYATMVWSRDAAYYNQAEWRGTRLMEGGGVLINQALHTLDLLAWMCGEPDYVVSSVSNLTLADAIEVEDTACALYSGKANFSFFATNGSKGNFEPEITVKTETETVHVFTDYVMINGEVRKFDRSLRVYGKNCYGSGHEHLIWYFYDCLEKGEKFPIDGEEGGKVIKLILGAYASNGKKIPL